MDDAVGGTTVLVGALIIRITLFNNLEGGLVSYSYRARKKAIKRAKKKHDTNRLKPEQMPGLNRD